MGNHTTGVYHETVMMPVEAGDLKSSRNLDEGTS